MLRCTVAGLIPLMNSDKYRSRTDEFYESSQRLFEDIVGRQSYYLLRSLPAGIARRLLEPRVPELLAAQKKTGMWKTQDTERITYDILRALDHIGIPAPSLPRSPLAWLQDRDDFYSLLIKKNVYHRRGNRFSAGPVPG